MEFELIDLIDASLFQTMLNCLNELYPFPTSIKDIHGKVLAQTAWVDVCNKFKCDSDNSGIQKNLPGEIANKSNGEIYPTLIYRCPHGMIDCITPIIIDGIHFGNLYAGEVFIDKPELSFFQQRAHKHGFDEKSYLSVIEKIPVWTQDQFDKSIAMLRSMLDVFVSIGSKNLREYRNKLKIEESESQYKLLFNTAPDAIFLADGETGIILDANFAASNLLGKPVSEIIGMNFKQLHPERINKFTEETFQVHRTISEKDEITPIENVVVRADGTEIPVEILANPITIQGKKVLQGIFRDITERKKIEQKLLISEIKHRTLTENLPDIISRFDKSLKYIYVNPAVEKLFGIPVNEFLGKTNEDLQLSADYVISFNINLKSVFDTGKQQRFEFSHNSVHSVKYFSSFLVPEFDLDGNVNSVLCVSTDISGIKKSKKSLRIQYEISLMLGRTSDLISSMNQLLDKICQLDGINCGGIYLIDELTGDINLVAHKGFSESFVENVSSFNALSINAEMINKGISYNFNKTDLDKQNDPVLLIEGIRALSIIPITYMGKAIASVNCASIIYDEIPEEIVNQLQSIAFNLGGTIKRLSSEKQLRENEEKYKLAFQTSPDAVNINRIDGTYVEINEGFISLMGYTKDEVIGKKSGELDIWVFPEHRQKLISELTTTGKIENLESVFKTKDGTLKTALMSASLIRINGENHILSITRDITERKIAENELIIAKEKAEESNRLKSSFLANLSHELRTPMNGILGFTELLDDESYTAEERHEFVTIINDSGTGLLDVITNLMDISKIDSRQIEMNLRLFDLNTLLAEILKWFKGEKVIRENAHLSIEFESGVVHGENIIYSDPGKLRHIMSLLLNNAAKFTNKGFVKFGYSIHEKRIRFFVHDSGKGIAPDKQKTIFERFRQEDETLSRKFGGVGLGLSIAKGLVELMNGEIGVESEIGKGSRFWFEVPVY